MSIIHKKQRKKMDLSYFERKFENFHMDIEKNLNVSKTKPVAPRRRPLLLLLFFQFFQEVGTCTEILPIQEL